MHTALQGLHGVEVIADDILVYGCGETEEESQKDHDANLQQLNTDYSTIRCVCYKHNLHVL